MSVKIELLKIAVRRRMAMAGIVDLNKEFQDYGGRTLDTAGLSFWIHEYIHGNAEERTQTDVRNRHTVMIFEYDLFIPAGGGTLALSEKEDEIRKEFNVNTERRYLSEGEASGEILRITSEDELTERYTRRSILLYIRPSAG